MAGNEKYSLCFGQNFYLHIRSLFCTVTVCGVLFFVLELLQNIQLQNIQSEAHSSPLTADDNVVLISIISNNQTRNFQSYESGSRDDIRFDDNSQAKKLWLSGIEAWRSGNKIQSAKLFSELADTQKKISNWQYSAANFWAYRAFLALGKEIKASHYLSEAARNPRVFYGILARKQLNKSLELNTDSVIKYPTPKWRPEGGFDIDPALIYALMRQESGFRPSAISPSGALGLMQLMPNTARKMQQLDVVTRATSKNISEPVLNITLGERYVKYLLGNDLVDGNLFYMLAAYNAGAGRLKNWQETISYNNDPLLFIESIPYSETRYYIMQVMTNYWIYSDLAGTPNKSIFSVLRGNWPNYSPVSAPIADAWWRDRNG